MTTKTCTIEDCTTTLIHGHGLCAKHYQRAKHSTNAEAMDRKCSVDNCPKRFYAKGLCRTHWARVRSTGSLEVRQPTLTCSVEDCTKKHVSLGYCSTHYARIRKHGSLDLQLHYEDLSGNRYGTLLVGERFNGGWNCRCDCGADVWVEFKKRLLKPQRVTCGDYKAHPELKEDVTYSAVHHRLRIARGPARTHSCIDCGHTAQEWSYNHQDPNEIEELNRGFITPYSLDVNNYDPRCVPCHRSFDHSRDLVRA